MITRSLKALIPRLRLGYPVIAITGPRQAGKSTLASQAAPDLPFINLENPLELARWKDDRRSTANLGDFFAAYPDGAIIDEVQHLPELFPALQAKVDADRQMGHWVLTGSQQFAMSRGISQSLAGRVANLELLPFSYQELHDQPTRSTSLTQAVFTGGYPPLYDPQRQLDPVRWLTDYVGTFLQRDLAGILEVRNRSAFTRFLGLCASLSGCQLNNAKLATALQIDGKTVEAWLSVLEAAYVIVRLRPYFRNFAKRIVKQPKLYFIDSGLACRMLQISDVGQLRSHPLWGNLVETWCVSEVLKARVHRGLTPQVWFWRSSDGHEVDLVLDLGSRLLPIEIKATRSPQREDASGLIKLRDFAARQTEIAVLPGLVIHDGDGETSLGQDRAVPWNRIAQALEPYA